MTAKAQQKDEVRERLKVAVAAKTAAAAGAERPRERSPRRLRQVPPEGADPLPVAPAAADPAAALARGQEQPEA